LFSGRSEIYLKLKYREPVENMQVIFFFRTPTIAFNSIENLFKTVTASFREVEGEKVFLPYKSAKPLAILKNILFARRNKGQVNHITGEVNYIALALPKNRTILTIHDIESLYSSNKLKHFFLKLIWLHLPVNKVKYITVVSEYSKRVLLNTCNVSEEKIFVIPNSVSLSNQDFKPKPFIDKQEPVLLQVGTKKNKNLENLIYAVEGFTCKLLIIGKLTNVQRELLYQKGIKYENHYQLPYGDVIKLYYRADIVTFVSTFEGFGIPILEAQALGRPVITSTTTAMPEVAGGSALIVDPYNTAQIREAIIKLVEDDSFRNLLVKAGYQNVQRFKPNEVAAQYEKVYKRIISGDK
jgi:glycosyltransferase involved in cell wall biosynthesis